MTMLKPFFMPLKTEYFEQFKNGTKSYELRKYSNRFCRAKFPIGRHVILSKGYGKKHRLIGTVAHINIVMADELSIIDRKAVVDCYGNGEIKIIQIWLKDITEVQHDN
jgi:hypothetical protein